MSYRIYISITKKEALDKFLLGDTSDFEFEEHDIIAELYDNLNLKQFTPIEQYKDEEYPPYILNKDDFQKILNCYKSIIFENMKEKEQYLNKLVDIGEEEIKIDRSELISIWRNYVYISNYFEEILNTETLIKTSGLFLLDYFYLVKMFENLKEDEVFLITHG